MRLAHPPSRLSPHRTVAPHLPAESSPVRASPSSRGHIDSSRIYGDGGVDAGRDAGGVNGAGGGAGRSGPPGASDAPHNAVRNAMRNGTPNVNSSNSASRNTSVGPSFGPAGSDAASGASGAAAGADSASGPGPTTTPAKRKEDEARVPKRGYRACVHCRLRKAKCDLGDVNAPSEPPCTRCRREQRNCVFLPSKRRRKANNEEALPEIYSVSGQIQPAPSHPSVADSTMGMGASGYHQNEQHNPYPTHQGHTFGAMPPHADWMGARPQMPGQAVAPGLNKGIIGGTPTSTPGVAAPGNSATHSSWPEPKASPLFDPPTNTTTSSLGSVSGSTSSPTNTTNASSWHRRRRHATEQDGARRIVVASFNNETDALEILAKAATGRNEDGGEADESDEYDRDDRRNSRGYDQAGPHQGPSGLGNADRRRTSGGSVSHTPGRRRDVGLDDDEDAKPFSGPGVQRKRVAFDDERARPISEFVLLERGIIDETTLEKLVKLFFEKFQPVLPIVQTARIPSSRKQLAHLVSAEPFLMAAIICVAAHHHPGAGMREVHDRTWHMLREVIADYACAGIQPSIGFVEGVLLLAEFLPHTNGSGGGGWANMSGRTKHEGGLGLHGTENRRAWALTGTAIRAAYGLGLDQLALEDAVRDPDLERARGVWTWCYLYDRTIGLRTGLAFWSRGPTICFSGYSNINQTGEAAAAVHFPYMMRSARVDDGGSGDLGMDLDSPVGGPSSGVPAAESNDSACMMQALLELTQIMTNAHDILFSTPARTATLVKKGEYFKFLEHFHRALDSFCGAWKDKAWHDSSARELTWCTYHFVRLYVAAFAFQAHVSRAQERGDAEREAGRDGTISLFPRGSATSPDALFIYESIDAAHEILAICIRLAQNGVLQYLPSRYLINFAYSGTFALKAAYSGAVGKADLQKTTEIVDRVCAALLLASPDKDHPACRYGQMLRILAKRLAELSDASAVPSRFPSPEAGAVSDTNPVVQLGRFDQVLNTSNSHPHSSSMLHPSTAYHSNPGDNMPRFASSSGSPSGPNLPQYVPGGPSLSLSMDAVHPSSFTEGADMGMNMGAGHGSNGNGNAGDGPSNTIPHFNSNTRGAHAHQQGGPESAGADMHSHGAALNDPTIAAAVSMFDLDQVPANLYDLPPELDMGFNLDGFWEDFTLTDSGGFPFR